MGEEVLTSLTLTTHWRLRMKPLRTSDVTNAVPLDSAYGCTTLDAINRRDALLAEAAKFYPGLSHRETARQLRSALIRFREGRWRRDRSEATCPEHHAGKLPELLWRPLRVRDAAPSARTIRLVLSRTASE